MKKIYLLVFSLIGISTIHAQITLTKSANEPVIGDMYDTQLLDTNSTPLPITVTGTNVIWNITNITAPGGLNTTTYASTASFTNASNYLGSTIVQNDGNATTFFKSTATQFELLGLDGGFFDLNYNTNTAIVSIYPISLGYLNSDNGSGTISATLNSTNYTGPFNSTIQTKGDATGTLNINGVVSLSNCLRVKSTQHITFTVNTFVQGTIDMAIYNYYHSSSKWPVFSINYSYLDVPIMSSFNQRQNQASALSTINVGIKENKLNDIIFKAYPNPTNQEVNIHFVLTQSESYTIEIINTLGQTVKTLAKPNLQPGVYSETINVGDLTAGIYQINVTGKNARGVEKLIIQ